MNWVKVNEFVAEKAKCLLDGVGDGSDEEFDELWSGSVR